MSGKNILRLAAFNLIVLLQFGSHMANALPKIVPEASASDSSSTEFARFSKELNAKFKKFNWKELKLEDTKWEYYRYSHKNRPLFFAIFGDNKKNCSMFLSGVHGDETPTVYQLLKLTHYLREHPELYKDKMIVLAPLVNPDGFLATPSTRYNGRGVDVNRNFPTRNWQKEALAAWKKKEKGDKRKFPGTQAGSENEIKFQIALIKRFNPQKIFSIHSPLGFYDADGPSSDLDNLENWLKEISKETNFPVKKFGFYPGSLGNYAGVEKGIFTLTLELPSSDPAKGESYYEKFKIAFLRLLDLKVPTTVAASE